MFCRSLRLHRRRRQNIREPNRRRVSVVAVARGEAQRSLEAVADAGRARAAEGKVVANFSLPKSEDSFRVSRKMATRWDPAARAPLPKLGVFQGGAFEDDLLVITGIANDDLVGFLGLFNIGGCHFGY